jgi:hypothetical protein
MEYAVITHAKIAVESCENDFSRAGKATFTIDKSSEPIKAPSDVTKNTCAVRRDDAREGCSLVESFFTRLTLV